MYSIVIIAKNEADNIGRCLASLSACQDVVVLDDDSEDATAAVAASFGARVVSHRFEGFAAQRNWALENVDLAHPWVLMLDADEALTPAVDAAIRRAVGEAVPDAAGFLMCRRNWFMDRWLRHCDGFPVWIMRVVHKDRARFVDSGHGEVPAPPVDGTLGQIGEPFLHYPFSHGLTHWLARHNRYSTREAELEFHDPPAWTWRAIVHGTRPERRRSLRNLGRNLPFRPLLRFCHHYIRHRGFLDGRAGLAYSLLMAGYEGIIALKRRERELEMKSSS